MTMPKVAGWRAVPRSDGVIVATAAIPVVGETVMRLRSFMIIKAVLRGGVADSASIPSDLLRRCMT